MAHLGWRGACLCYALIQVAVSLPIYLLVVPREPALATTSPSRGPKATAPSDPQGRVRPRLSLLAAAITTASLLSTVLSVHLLTVLQSKGLTLPEAVALGALVGPSQVGARAIELVISHHHHPIWTKVVASTLVTVAMAALWVGGPWLTLGIALYGDGIGLDSIARGTLPLAIGGPRDYPIVMGWIARPNLLVQAVAPLAGALSLGLVGASGTMAVLGGVAGLALVFSFTLLRSLGSPLT